MPQFIIAILVAWLVFTIVGYLLQIVFYSALPVLAGWAVFVLVRSALRLSLKASVDRNLADLVTLSVAGGNIRFEALGNAGALVQEEEWRSVVPAMAACTVTGILFIVVLANGYYAPVTSEISFPKELTNFLGFASCVAGLGGCIAYSDQRSSHESRVRAILDERVRQFNQQASATGEFQYVLRRNTALREALKAAPDNALEAMLFDIEHNLAGILAGTRSLHSFIEKHRARLEEDNRHLERAVAAHDRLLETYDEACIMANRAGNEAILWYLDIVSRAIDMLQQVVMQRQWRALHEHLASATDELGTIIQNAGRFSQQEQEGSDPAEEEEPANDPYEVLGVRADLSDDEIKSVYRSLAQIYHPDKARAPDHSKFQQIQAAWNTIRRQRGI
jgi:DnaJ-domain-containing protein 1